MRQYFDEQLQGDSIIVTSDILSKLQGSPRYGEYQVEDQICLFMEQTIVDEDWGPSIHLTLKTIKEADLDNLVNDYTFERMDASLPVLCAK